MARNWFSAFVLLLALNILELWYYSLGLYPCWFFQNRATQLLYPDIINTFFFPQDSLMALTILQHLSMALNLFFHQSLLQAGNMQLR